MSTGTLKPEQYRKWLPYWAVFQTDMQQTVHTWIYRLWLLASILILAGFFTYRFGVYKETGIIQHGSLFFLQSLRWTILGSMTLVFVLTTGCISSERGTLADSVLSRGISRYQYFLGKWHARLVTVIGTFLLLGSITILGCIFFLHEDLSFKGCVIALIAICALLFTVVTCCVTVSAIINSTVLGIITVWVLLYGVTLGLSYFPSVHLSPEVTMQALPHMVKGEYDIQALGRLLIWTLGISLGISSFGMLWFARRDI